MDTYFGYWTCPNCGAHTPNGQSHVCLLPRRDLSAPMSTSVVFSNSDNAALWRIERALEDVVALLTAIKEKL